jgi:tetratricopeptide (TPR) repeat protein
VAQVSSFVRLATLKRTKIKPATMRNPLTIVALVAALLTLGLGGSVQAQPQSQPVPDAPQPQKKPAPKTQPTDPPADQPAPKPAPAKNDNPFPEDVSRDAAKGASGDDSKHPTAQDNPFPEDVSRDAAKAAGNSDLPAGVSSSQSRSSSGDAENDITDPGLAKKDAEVGGFYLKSRDYQGALLRYQDAVAADPTNVEAIFGLAETQRMLKKNAEAARNYQLYLEIVPNGPKSKQALKALKTLPPG